MATVDEILMTMADTGEETVVATDEVLVIDPNTRQINLPGSELVFGVESDTHSERKYFQAPRMVGNGIDLASCFIRVNFRNANGAIDSYLVNDVVVTDDVITFSWELSRKVTEYKGMVMFVVCACRPGATAVEWNTTQASGIVLAGLEPDSSTYEAETADVVAQLLAMVEAQTVAVENVGAAQVAAVKNEGATQVSAVEKAATDAESAAVAEIEAKGVNTLASIPDDYTALGEAVTAIERGMAPGIVCEAAGNAVVLGDASNQAVQGLRIFGRSTQTGTPTPTAPVEIVSVESPVVTVAGKNLLDVAEIHTFTGHEAITVKIPPGQYVVSNKSAIAGGEASPYVRFGKNKCGVNIGSSGGEKIVTLSVPETTVYLYSSGYSDSLSKDVTSTVEQLMVSAMGGSYAPYTFIQTAELTHTLPGIPVTSGGNYTDSDGQQWICDEVDFERGVYVQRIKTDTVTISSRGVLDNGLSAGIYKAPDKLRLLAAGAICDRAKFVGISGSAKNPNCFYENLNNFGFTGAETDTLEMLRAAYDGATVAYILATPIETPLSETELAAWRTLHTNKPNTTVLNDQGAHMAVAYVADTKLYIDNKITALLGEA